mmetsp:Transcript_13040/g.33434  ORF Transcript_13040/g.33434 Transcript_13040/m.33434 type:complete len:91 (+) Transcript_13040:423-695(+)
MFEAILAERALSALTPSNLLSHKKLPSLVYFRCCACRPAIVSCRSSSVALIVQRLERYVSHSVTFLVCSGVLFGYKAMLCIVLHSSTYSL